MHGFVAELHAMWSDTYIYFHISTPPHCRGWNTLPQERPEAAHEERHNFNNWYVYIHLVRLCGGLQ